MRTQIPVLEFSVRLSHGKLWIMKNFGVAKNEVSQRLNLDANRYQQFYGECPSPKSLLGRESLGAVVHFNERNSICIPEAFNKIVTSPWCTTTSTGYTKSG